MPIYEYVCEECGKKFDALRSMKDADAAIGCKSCASLKTHRVLSVCYAHGDQQRSSSSGGGCSGCSGGSCSSCRG